MRPATNDDWTHKVNERKNILVTLKINERQGISPKKPKICSN